MDWIGETSEDCKRDCTSIGTSPATTEQLITKHQQLEDAAKVSERCMWLSVTTFGLINSLSLQGCLCVGCLFRMFSVAVSLVYVSVCLSQSVFSILGALFILACLSMDSVPVFIFSAHLLLVFYVLT